MKLIRTLLTFSTLSIALTSYAQWVPKNSFDSTERMDAMAFTVNGKIYLAGGRYGDTGFQDLWEYDPAADKWTRKADLLHFGYKAAAAFAIGNKGYIATGERGSMGFTPGSELYEYDPAMDKWTQKTGLFSVFAEDRSQAIGFSLNGKGYVGGGYAIQSSQGGGGSVATAFGDIWAYDPAADKWAYETDIPGGVLPALPSRSSAIAVTVGNHVYVGTGCDGEASTAFSDFYRYSPATKKWDTLAALTDAVAEATAFAIGADIFVVGGSRLPVLDGTSAVRRYNTLTDKWSLDESFPEPVTSAVAGVVNGKAYFGTGTGDFFSTDYRNSWFEFSPKVVSVTTMANEPKVSVYPNPFGDALRVSLQDAPKSEYYLVMHDITGREVHRTAIYDKLQSTVALHHLQRGYYTLTITDKTGIRLKTEQVVKQ